MPPPPDFASRVEPSFLAALEQPESYPHHPQQVEMVQTHISVVFLAGDLVYKLKKPVRFSFLDYSTLALRHHYCQEEVRLNRRLAPSVYLGVVPVRRTAGGYRVDENSDIAQDSEIVDYLVKMRRLPTDRTLGCLVEQGRVGKEGIHALARRLVDFHGAAATEQAGQYGAPAAIRRATDDNFADTAAFVGQTLSRKQYNFIRSFTQQFLSEHDPLLLQRIQAGRVREGHGDLRCDHVYFLDEGVVIIDCVEFNPALRTCDVASELAFLTMDLDMHHASALAAELAHSYAIHSQDEELLQLLPFYQCYRAYVRGKVESFRSQEPEVAAEERAQAQQHARCAFRFAYRYARGTPRPALVVVCGRIASGKSTVAQLLSEHTGFAVFNSDVVRKRLAGLSPTARAETAYGTGLYSKTFTERTYATLHRLALEELQAGRGAVVDATCKRRADRRTFLELGQRCGVSVLFVECRASVAERERRVRARAQRADSVSDASWTVALQQQNDFQPFDDLPTRCHIVVDTEESLEDAVTAAEESLFELSAA